MGARSGSSLWGAALLCGIIAAPAHGRPRTPAAPRGEVILRSRDTALKVGTQSVAAPEMFHVYRVERAQDGWLWVVGGGVRGWAREADTIPYDRALDELTAAITARPDDPWAYQMRGLVYAHEREFERAIADDTRAIALEPDDPVPYHNRGNVRLALRDYDGAIADYSRATALDGRDAASYACRALARAGKRDYDLAIADENRAIRLGLRSAAVYRQRAHAWAAKQDFAQAQADYAEALTLEPDDARSDNGRAWIWATAPDRSARDGRKAVEAARRAVEHDGGNAYFLGTLAAAYAERGDFKEAVAWQTKAVERFSALGVDQAPHRARLELYKTGKPYRDEPPS